MFQRYHLPNGNQGRFWCYTEEMSLRTRPPLPRFSVSPPGFRVPVCIVFSDQEFGRSGGGAYRTTERVEEIGDEFRGKIGSIIARHCWPVIFPEPRKPRTPGG